MSHRRTSLVILESPYRALKSEDPLIGRETNVIYLQACIRDCLTRGEAPFASHQMYTLALDDVSPADRDLGMGAGFAWHFAADYMVVYTDRGISSGMRAGMAHARALDIRVLERSLGGQWAKP
jgi:hypothetical protein